MGRFMVAFGIALAGLLVLAGGASAHIAFEDQFSTPIPREAFTGDSLAASNDGSLYMVDDASGRVFKFDQEGRPLRGWKLKEKAPSAIAVDPGGNVLVAYEARIDRYTATGGRLGSWSLKKAAKKGTFGILLPVAMDADDSGFVYLLDLLNARIVRISPRGKYLGDIGRSELQGGRLMVPGDLAAGPDGRVYVTDSIGDEVQVYGPRGKFLKSWGRPGAGHGAFESAESIAVDELGRVYVGDPVLSRVQIFDAEGRYLDQRGSEGTGASRFSLLGDIVTTVAGGFLIADRRDRRIQRFTYADGPHAPQAQLWFRGTRWAVGGAPGSTVPLEYRVVNFGGLMAEGIRICPAPEGRFGRKLFRGVSCRTLAPIAPATKRTVRFRVRIPREVKKKELKLAMLRLRSANAGGGRLATAVFTSRKFRWPDY